MYKIVKNPINKLILEALYCTGNCQLYKSSNAFLRTLTTTTRSANNTTNRYTVTCRCYLTV